MKKINLNNVRIASPCPVSWEEMEGAGKVRYCELCQLNVYNLSNMKRKEAEQVLLEHEGKDICISIHVRRDGTVLTRDCPVGLKAFKERVYRLWKKSILSISFVLFCFFFGKKLAEEKLSGENLQCLEEITSDSGTYDNSSDYYFYRGRSGDISGE